jgi:hypothetical protein
MFMMFAPGVLRHVDRREPADRAVWDGKRG